MKRLLHSLLALFCVLLVVQPALAFPMGARWKQRPTWTSRPIWLGPPPTHAPPAPSSGRIGAAYGPIPPPGNAGTVPFSQGTTSLAAWQPLSQDVTCTAGGVCTVSGLQASALPSLATCLAAGGYLLWNGTAWTCGAGGTTVTWANDLAGSNATHQWVQSISGNGGLGGTVNVTASTLAFQQTSSITSPTATTLTIDGPTLHLGTSLATTYSLGNTSTLAALLIGHPLEFFVQSTQVGQLNLASGDWIQFGPTPASATGGGKLRFTNGDTIVSVRDSGNTTDLAMIVSNSNNLLLGGTGSGGATTTELVANSGGSLKGFINLTQAFQMGLASGDFVALGPSPPASGAVRIANGTAVKSVTTGAVDATLAVLNSSNNLFFGDGNAAETFIRSADKIQFQPSGGSATDLYLDATNIHVPNTQSGAYTWVYDTAIAANNPQNLVIQGQAPNASCASSATCSPGDVLVALSAPGATGSPTEATFGVKRGSSVIASLGGWTVAPSTFGALSLGTGTQYAVASDGANTTYISGGTEIVEQIGGTSYLHLLPTSLNPITAGQLSLGTTSLPWGAADFGNPTSAAGGGGTGMGFQFLTPTVNSGLAANANSSTTRYNITARSTSVSGVTLKTITLPASGSYAFTFCLNWSAVDLTALNTANGAYTCAAFQDFANVCSQIGSTSNVVAFSTSIVGVTMTVSGCVVTIKQTQASGTDTWDLMGELTEIENNQ